MNLFEQAKAIEAKATANNRKGSKGSLKNTYTIPFFKGTYRRGDAYLSEGIYTMPDKGYTDAKGYLYKGKEIVDLKSETFKGFKAVKKGDKVKVQFSVKGLTGAFIITYASCLAFAMCKAAKQPVTLSIIEAILQNRDCKLDLAGSFDADDYSQGKVVSLARISAHLKAIALQRGLNLTVNNETGEVTGLDKYACEVLKAF